MSSQPVASTASGSAGRARPGPGHADTQVVDSDNLVEQTAMSHSTTALLAAAITEARQTAQSRRLQSPGRRDSDNSAIAQRAGSTARSRGQHGTPVAIARRANRGLTKRVEVTNKNLDNSQKFSKLNWSPFRHIGASKGGPMSSAPSRNAFKNIR